MDESTVAIAGAANGVTIGIPVFNEQDRIERAVRSAASQCERLVVADNASTDNTERICRGLLAEFPHMEYIRHACNLGALENWYFLLSITSSPYFMTLGSHDYIDENFIETVRGVLAADPSVVLAAGGLCYEYESEEVAGPSRDVAFGAWTAGRHDDPAVRVRSFLFDRVRLPWAMYGVFRTDAYKACFTRDIPPYGVDTVFLAKIAYRGKIVVVNDTSYHAWIRCSNEPRSTYVERLIGKKEGEGVRKYMRNAMRVALFEVMLDSEQPATGGERVALRYKAMERFGMFKRKGFDLWFYVLYAPVKLARKFRRFRQKVGGGCAA